jgi:hypothetical protein
MNEKNNRLRFLDWTMTGFIIAVVFMLISSINTIRYVYVMQKDLRTWYEKDLVGQNSVQIARVNLLNMDRDLKAVLLGRSPDETGKLLSNISKNRKIFVKQMTIARPLFTTKKAAEQLETVYRRSREYLGILDAIMFLHGPGREEALYRSYADITARFEEIDRELNKLDDFKQEKDLRVFQNIIAQNEAMMVISFAVLILSIIFRLIQFSAIRKKKNIAR